MEYVVLLTVLAMCGAYGDQPLQPIVLSVNKGTDTAAIRRVLELLNSSIISLSRNDIDALKTEYAEILNITSAFTTPTPPSGVELSFSQLLQNYYQSITQELIKSTVAYVGIRKLMNYMNQIAGIVLHFLINIIHEPFFA